LNRASAYGILQKLNTYHASGRNAKICYLCQISNELALGYEEFLRTIQSKPCEKRIS
jgi:hypothetical protein